MNTPIRREANILGDDITHRHGLPAMASDGRITAADLVGAEHERPAVPAVIDVEPLAEPVVDNTAQRAEREEVVASTATTVGAPSAAVRGAAAARALAQETGPLFSGNEANELRAQWDAIQVGFVDEPRGAVKQADNLVAGTMKRLAEVFAAERSKLEGQWDQGENVSTEDLRLALRRYRSFFSRLLSV